MKCPKCEAKFPSYYKECPCCKNKAIEKEVYAPQELEIEVVEPVSPFVEGGDIDDMGSD